MKIKVFEKIGEEIKLFKLLRHKQTLHIHTEKKKMFETATRQM